MYYFFKGKVEFLAGDSIILNVNNIGYQIFVSHINYYKVNDIVTVFLYNVIKEDCNYLVGFKTIEEKKMFLQLIKVNGLGPKTAISALRITTPEEIQKAISCGNISFLRKLPGIGDRAARQIVLDLKDKYSPNKGNSKLYDEAKEGLQNLGFKKAAIERVLATINEPDITVEELIKLALVKLRK